MHKSFLNNILLIFSIAMVFTTGLRAEEAVGSSKQSEVEKIDVSHFADVGHVRQPYLSPDGSKMVYREQVGGKTYLTHNFLDGDKNYRVRMPEDSDLNWYRWLGSGKILFSVSSLRKAKFGEYRIVEMYAIDIATRKTRFVGPKKRTMDGDNVLFFDPHGRYLLMSVQQSIYEYPKVIRLDIETNESVEIVPDQLKIWKWVADNKGVVRLGMSYRLGAVHIYYRSKDGDKFKKIGKLKHKDSDDKREEALIDITNIIAESDEGYILSNKETGRFALYKFNFLTREKGEMVFGHAENDVTGFYMNTEGTKLESVRYTDSRDRIKWFDPALGKRQLMLNKALPGTEVWIASKSKDGGKMIILSTSPRDPGSYYLYEPAERTMERFARINDNLDPDQLSATKYDSYTARDGTKIPAYVTIPKGRDKENLPLIIMPHGGPFGTRDTLDYNSQVQFLANRGYAVLQPNFRGSGSYGEAFYKLGVGQIGRAMQDDLDDGMDWLVKRGVVDPKRVCIVGASYGGYAAIWGVTRNPERYRCAASFAGVTDWKKQLSYDTRYFRNRYSRDWKEKIKGTEKLNLNDVSPVKNIKKLRRPVLLVHGEKDSNVPFSQFTQYKKQLKKHKADAEFVTYKKEGHGFSDPKNMADWLTKLEAFLEKHNPA